MNKKNVFKQTILSLSNGVVFFDSHSFIKKLRENYSDVYNEYINDPEGINHAHGRIAVDLSRMEGDLGIQDFGRLISINTLGNLSQNTLWKIL